MGLLDKDLEQVQASSGYKFSATKISALGAAEYTLATIVQDASSSVSSFAQQLETAIKTVFKACEKSPRKDNLMLRLTQFSDGLIELHGFTLLGSLKEDQYTGILQIGGMTALLDAADEAITATASYGKTLTDQDFLVNGIVVVVTDGENNKGRIRNADHIKKTLATARRSENLESLKLILVGVTNDDNNLNTYLQTLKDEGGFDQYVSIGKATPGRIAKLADFVSQSISSTSSALGSGGPSQPLNPAAYKF